MLLDQLREAARQAGCTIFTLQASDDPRALTSYFRFGLFPLAPNVVWSGQQPSFPAQRMDNPFEAVPLTCEDEATLNTVGDIDKAVRGVRRWHDLVRWLREGESGALLIDRPSGRPAGYYLVSSGTENARIGPVAAMDRERFAEVLGTALTAAGALHAPDRIWKLAMPGENQAAVAPLLAAGFRPDYATTFFASEPIGRFDRYVFHDLDLL
jgi:GNAT acetyltransferase-like protein